MNSTSTYIEGIVAFLDIAGVKEAVKKSQSNSDITETLRKMYSDLQQRCLDINSKQKPEAKIPNIKTRLLSDSIIITCPSTSDDALRLVAVMVSAFQMNTIVSHHYFVRGAITTGLFYEDDNILFGPAYVEAYECEKQLANWFRVIVHPKVLTLATIGEHPYLVRDNAGVTYIDYLLIDSLSLIVKDFPTGNSLEAVPVWIKSLKWHVSAIENAVKAIDPNDLSLLYKYHSVAQYHNRFINKVQGGPLETKMDQLLELMLSKTKGVTKKQLAAELNNLKPLFEEMDAEVASCKISVPKIFPALYRRQKPQQPTSHSSDT
jgi:hypothetical protein